MDEEQERKYREAADKLWELALQFHGFEVCDDLKEFVSVLHAKAGGRKSVLIVE